MKKIRGAVLALFALTLGSMAALAQTDNTAYGTHALYSDTSGSYNAAFGYSALVDNTTGNSNTAIGFGTLYYATTTSENTAVGAGALSYTTSGNDNTAIGANALYSNTAGSSNTAVGVSALQNNTTATYNTAIGWEALYSNTSGEYNTATGYEALASNTTGTYNSAHGYGALGGNSTGSYNTAEGSFALAESDHGSGSASSAFGYSALPISTGSNNTAVGYEALDNDGTGGDNIGIGYEAGYNITSGTYNIDIGSIGSSSDSGTIRIGTPGTQTSFFAAGIDGVTVSSGVEVFINSSGQLGTVNSSLRFKEDVHDMGDASSAILRLRPVTYRYKQPYADGSKPIDYGLIAEEVAEVYPDLVVRGTDGQIQTVQYQKLTPMLLNELQKQHQLVEQMGKTMAQQQETIRLLKTQQTETIQLLEKRLAALEAQQQSSARLEARVATQ